MTLEQIIERYCLSNPMSEGIERGRYGEGNVIYRGSSTARDSFEVCRNLPKGFTEVSEWRDGWHGVQWICQTLLATVGYCEGDVLVSVHTTPATYLAELEVAAKFYGTDVPAFEA